LAAYFRLTLTLASVPDPLRSAVWMIIFHSVAGAGFSRISRMGFLDGVPGGASADPGGPLIQR